MERFLNEEAIQKSRDRVRLFTRILAGLAGLMLALFIALCLLTRTGNARMMLYLAMISTVLAGWGLIALWQFGAEPARAKERHLTGLAEAEKEIREGRIFLTDDSFRIPASVRVRKVRLETETEDFSLNLNEELVRRMPPDGSLVRAETARKFITGLEVLETGTENPASSQSTSRGKVRRAIGRFFLPAVLWGMMAVLLTGFVFNQITDTTPANKIVLYADCEVRNAPELAEKLEKELGGAVRMVKIHPFTYAMFDSARLKQADLFIIPDSHRAEYGEWLSEEEAVTVFDPSSGTAAAPEVFLYAPEGAPAEVFRLYQGKDSVHLEDGLGRRTAELFLAMTEPVKEGNP